MENIKRDFDRIHGSSTPHPPPPPPPRWDRSKGQISTFSAPGHVAKQVQGNQ